MIYAGCSRQAFPVVAWPILFADVLLFAKDSGRTCALESPIHSKLRYHLWQFFARKPRMAAEFGSSSGFRKLRRVSLAFRVFRSVSVLGESTFRRSHVAESHQYLGESKLPQYHSASPGSSRRNDSRRLLSSGTSKFVFSNTTAAHVLRRMLPKNDGNAMLEKHRWQLVVI